MKLVRVKPVRNKPVVEKSVKREERNEDFEALVLGKTTFSEIYDEAKKIGDNSEDFVVRKVNCDNFKYLNEHRTNAIKFEVEEGNNRVSNISDYAMSQLCNKIGIPYQYMKRCLASERFGLVEHNVNSWIDNYNKDFFVREHNNTVRGILTPRYSVFDTHEILEVMSEVFPVDDYTIKGYFLSPERFHVRFVSPTPLDIPNEDLFPGISIDSSDVGRSHLRVNFFIWKQVCTNGMIVPKKFGMLYTKRHMGIESKEFREELTHSLDSVEPLVAKVTESIVNTASVSLEDTFKDEKSLEKLIESVMKTTGMKENGANKVISLVQNETYPMNKWGLINSLTEVAQDYTLEKRIEIEKIAGELLVA